MEYNTINVEIVGVVAQLKLNKPEVRNAFNEHMISELHKAITKLAEMPDIRVIVVTGEGTAFSAGADLDWMKRMGQSDFATNSRDAMALAYMLDAFYNCPKPVVARVNGSAIGGGMGLIAVCDIAVTEEKAIFSFSEVKLGLVPACIAPYIIRKAGENNTRELFMTGRRITAAEAKNLGLVNSIASADKLDVVVGELVNQLIASGPSAVSAVKKLIREVYHQSREEYIPYTAKLIARLRTSPEGKEGVMAFLEKRKANWIVE